MMSGRFRTLGGVRHMLCIHGGSCSNLPLFLQPIARTHLSLDLYRHHRRRKCVHRSGPRRREPSTSRCKDHRALDLDPPRSLWRAQPRHRAGSAPPPIGRLPGHLPVRLHPSSKPNLSPRPEQGCGSYIDPLEKYSFAGDLAAVIQWRDRYPRPRLPGFYPWKIVAALLRLHAVVGGSGRRRRRRFLGG